jgi:uncharacterized protein
LQILRVAVFLLAIAIWCGLHYYLFRRYSRVGLGPRLKRVLAVTLGLLSVLAPLTMSLGRIAGDNGPAAVVMWGGYIYMAFLSIVLALTAMGDLGRLGLWGGRKVGLTPKVDPSRRTFLLGGLNITALGVAGVTTGLGVVEARRKAVVEHVDVPVEGLAEGLDGLKIAQITDLHASPTIKRPFIARVVAQVNALDADLVAVTGDIADAYVPDRGADLAVLGDLRSKHGTFYVTGNHEYYWDAPGWIAHMRSIGVRPLLNEHVVIDHNGAPMVIGGVTDYRAANVIPEHASDPHSAARDAPTGVFKLLLAHQPRSVFEAAKAGFDLQISGHTHGGQFVPWNFIVWLAQPFTTGLHAYESMKIYVSRGTGYWGPPVRTGIPPEITLLTLRKA